MCIQFWQCHRLDCGGAMLTSFSMNYRFTGLVAFLSPCSQSACSRSTQWRCETDTEAIHRMREIKVD